MDLFKAVWPDVTKQVLASPEFFPNGMDDLKLVIDNSGPSQRARTTLKLHEALGLQKHQVLWHPPQSPDFQSPIEQAWPKLNSAVRKLIRQGRRGAYTLEEFKELFRTAWLGSTDPLWPPLHAKDEVKHQVDNMMEQLKEVHASGGSWGKRKRG